MRGRGRSHRVRLASPGARTCCGSGPVKRDARRGDGEPYRPHAGAVLKRQEVGRNCPSRRAPKADAPAVSAPRIASRMKWFAVATITKAISSGYSRHKTLAMRVRESEAKGQPIIRANAT